MISLYVEGMTASMASGWIEKINRSQAMKEEAVQAVEGRFCVKLQSPEWIGSVFFSITSYISEHQDIDILVSKVVFDPSSMGMKEQVSLICGTVHPW
jgi:hypothetical protein